MVLLELRRQERKGMSITFADIQLLPAISFQPFPQHISFIIHKLKVIYFHSKTITSPEKSNKNQYT